MKFFINKPENVVNESIEGLLTDPKLTKLDTFPEVRVVTRKEIDTSKVAIISGGGSGHEPMHAGFVAKGMLTAAVCGDIFASPSVDAVLAAILAVSGEKGCLLVIKNYTGDRLNFGLAAEQARALGHKVETVIVGDDIALGEDTQQRGLAGTLLVHKVAGQLAEEGKSLEEVTKAAKKVAESAISIGLSLSEGQKFNNPEESRLDKSEAELGLGIHGEPGVDVIKMDEADALVKKAVDKLKEYLPDEKQDYVLLFNNLGSVTPLEMNLLVHSFDKTDISGRVKYLVGPTAMTTSLNMNGFSITLLKLDEEIEKALLEKTDTPEWRIRAYGKPSSIKSPELPKTMQFEPSENKKHQKIVENIADYLIEMEKEMNDLDEKVGDGDAGSTFAAAGKKFKKVSDKLPYASLPQLFTTIGRVLARETGGSSGVLLSMLFTKAGSSLEENDNVGRALLSGLEKMKSYGGAEQGDRTMIDAMQPAFEGLSEKKSIKEAAEAARKGADKTAKITNTSAGRSSYLSESSLEGIPDPGAEMVARVFEKLVDIV
ncbi:dihydroxyacetone kinase subunit DhaK [Zunongwangia profunda]|jgi:dihydroxyacetone kinase|uniref:dihydroxyacetone kinase subunit DhaK n=1 Tax=Zunongwangia profunda TaxID=398743 RepID=UPI001D183605|nr:dihydroxyacetone kinase subunit DhaK [Zunongwangia profunda]MCC4226905.1 dihydroxyacetone kinase subunit DhaK [Zunongwangia profunda]